MGALRRGLSISVPAAAAEIAIELDPCFVKAYVRKAKAPQKRQPKSVLFYYTTPLQR